MKLISAAIPMIFSAVSISDRKIRISMPPGTEKLAFPLPDPRGASRDETRALRRREQCRRMDTLGSQGKGVARMSKRLPPRVIQALTASGERSAGQAADDFPEPAGLVGGQIDEREGGAVGVDAQH